MTAPRRARPSSCTMFLAHTQRRTTVGRTPLDEWSALRRDLYLTTHNTHNKHPCPPVGFEPAISTRERPQIYALERGHRDQQATSVLGGFGGQRWTSTAFHQGSYRGVRCTGGCTGPCGRFTEIRNFSPLSRISNHGPFSVYRVTLPTQLPGPSGA
jgi:hypothetical protein